MGTDRHVIKEEELQEERDPDRERGGRVILLKEEEKEIYV